MPEHTPLHAAPPVLSVERMDRFLEAVDLNDLCDATDTAIEGGGGFGWVRLPARDILERYWRGVAAMPSRILFVARIDGVICGSAQLVTPPPNNEAQSHAVQVTGNFIAPWARGHGLAKMLLAAVERAAVEEGFSVINLDVRETMERAIALYESAGYIRFGTHPYYANIDGKFVRGFYYTKALARA